MGISSLFSRFTKSKDKRLEGVQIGGLSRPIGKLEASLVGEQRGISIGAATSKGVSFDATTKALYLGEDLPLHKVHFLNRLKSGKNLNNVVFGGAGVGKQYAVIEPFLDSQLQEMGKRQLSKHKLPYINGITVIEPLPEVMSFIMDKASSLEGIKPKYILPPNNEESWSINILDGSAEVAFEKLKGILPKNRGAEFLVNRNIILKHFVNLVKAIEHQLCEKANLERFLQVLEDLEGTKRLFPRLVDGLPKDEQEWFTRFFEDSEFKESQSNYILEPLRFIKKLQQHPLLQKVFFGKNDIDFSEHLNNGGVLIVNSNSKEEFGSIIGKATLICIEHTERSRESIQEGTFHHIMIKDDMNCLYNEFSSYYAIVRRDNIFFTFVMQDTEELSSVPDVDEFFKDFILVNSANHIRVYLSGRQCTVERVLGGRITVFD